MVFVIEDKKYDTNKMEKVANVEKWYKFTGVMMKQMLGDNAGSYRNCELWKTKKGNWLLTGSTGAYTVGEAISEGEAKKLLLRYDCTKYEELFGEIEEA